MYKKILSAFLALILTIGIMPAVTVYASATPTVAYVETVFFYVTCSSGQRVLAYAAALDELHNELSRGGNDAPGVRTVPFHASFTDNLPAARYSEGFGFTLPELVGFVSRNTSVPEFRNNLTYTGFDRLSFRPSDNDDYRGSYTYHELYGVNRYFFPRFFNAERGWRRMDGNNWETNHGHTDPFFPYGDDINTCWDCYFSDDKNWVFEERVPMPVFLSTVSACGRIREGDGAFSRNTGEEILRSFYEANNGDITGFWRYHEMLDRSWSLRLTIPQTEQDLRTGVRTAFNNTFRIYDMTLDMVNSPVISAGAVSPPEVVAHVEGGQLILNFSVEDGVRVFHTLSGESVGDVQAAVPQIELDGPIVLNLDGRSLSSQPLQFRARAVKEGYTDAGNIEITISGPTVTAELRNLEFNVTESAERVINTPFNMELSLDATSPFMLYGAQIEMRVDDTEFTVGTVTPHSGWQTGFARYNGITYVTFVYLNANGTSAGVVNSVASIQLTPLIDVALDVTWQNAKMTDRNASFLPRVLLPGEVDKSLLAALVGDALNLAQADYTTGSWAIFASALYTAEAALANEFATREEVNGAYSALRAAMDGLVSRRSRTPEVLIPAIEKVSEPQNRVEFTLTEPIPGGTWAVYAASTGSDVPAGITIEVEGTRLVIVHDNDVPAGVYYVAVTEYAPEMIESYRLPLIVSDMRPFDPLRWDGSIDIGWYNPYDDTFTLTTAAEFAGFAAIVNNKPLRVPLGRFDMSTFDPAIHDINNEGLDPNFPADDFHGRTVILAADLDLGGIEVRPGSLEGNTWVNPIWHGQVWRPIGSGSGSSDSNNGERGRTFKGTFDGGFHTISNMFIPWCEWDPDRPGGNAGGIAEFDNPENNNKALFACLGPEGLVKNVVIGTGYVHGARFTAGVVGRNWGTICSTANFATIVTRGSRSGGGIAGVSFFNGFPNHTPTIRNSFNAGLISMGDTLNHRPGGIVADNQGIVYNSFNIGRGIHRHSGGNMGGIVGGGRNIGIVENSFSLEGVGMPTGIIGITLAIPPGTGILSAEQMRSAEFVRLLGDAFHLDTDGINQGFPVLSGMGGTPVGPAEYMLGDLDGDGLLTIADVILLRSAVAEPETLTPEQRLIADVNRDGNLTTDDVDLLRRVVVELETLW